MVKHRLKRKLYPTAYRIRGKQYRESKPERDRKKRAAKRILEEYKLFLPVN